MLHNLFQVPAVRLATILLLLISGPPFIEAADYTVVTLAGPVEADPGATDGPGGIARFKLPLAATMDSAGNLYVADTGNHVVRKISLAGQVATIAGLAGQAGREDGLGATARFNSPSGIVVDGAGCLYVADSANHTIRRISPHGLVRTIAGQAGVPGTNDGAGLAARFNWPRGLAFNNAGSLFIADSDNFIVRRMGSDRTVSTFAGMAGQPCTNDGPGAIAGFAWPCDLAFDPAGNLFVADRDSSTIRKITPDGLVCTFAGQAGQNGTNDGPGSVARFNGPGGISVGPNGQLYVADTFNHTLRRITLAGFVDTLSGSAGNPGGRDGLVRSARFNFPSAVLASASGSWVVVDWGNHMLRAISPAGEVTTLAGPGALEGNEDGPGPRARFFSPARIGFAGNALYMADCWNHTIRRISLDGIVSTFAGSPGQAGTADGQGNAARFNYPSGVAVDREGSIYVADSGNHTIRKISSTGLASTLAGTAGNFGTNDGTGAAAEFYRPSGVAVGADGTIYVADSGNHTIRKISPQAAVTTFAGAPRLPGTNDGSGTSARLFFPSDVALDSTGELYVADQANHTIRKITRSGAVSTLAGVARQAGEADGKAAVAMFNSPAALSVDGKGNVLVADKANHTIRRISPNGEVVTLAGCPGSSGSTDASGRLARFKAPSGICTDPQGNFYVADTGNHCVRKGSASAPDRAVIDQEMGRVAVPRQLAVEPVTTVDWSWTLVRRPAASVALLPLASVQNPVFVPDAPDLYVFRMFATNGAGQVVAISSLQLTAWSLHLQSDWLPAAGFKLTVHSPPGESCDLLVSTNLGGWSLLTSFVNATGSDVLLEKTAPEPRRFYRLRQADP